MQRATMSVLGVYSYDNSVFDEFQLPGGMDKELQIQHILMECAEMELLYNKPALFKTMVGVWSRANILNWQKLYDTTQFVYDPIENYNRQDDFNEDTNRDETGVSIREENISRETKSLDEGSTSENSNSKMNETRDGTTTSTNSGEQSSKQTGSESTEASGNKTVTETVSAFNSSDYANKNKTSENHSDDATVTSTKTDTGNYSGDSRVTDNSHVNGTSEETKAGTSSLKKTGSSKDTEKDETNNNLLVEENRHNYGRSHGNIGVTTTQQMIQQERDIWKWNIYEHITREFKEKFCVLIY